MADTGFDLLMRFCLIDYLSPSTAVRHGGSYTLF